MEQLPEQDSIGLLKSSLFLFLIIFKTKNIRTMTTIAANINMQILFKSILLFIIIYKIFFIYKNGH